MLTRITLVLAIGAVIAVIGFTEVQKIKSDTSRLVSLVPLSLFPATVAEAETHLENTANGIQPRPADYRSMSEITVVLDGCVLTWKARYDALCGLTTIVSERQMWIDLVTVGVWGLQSPRATSWEAPGYFHLSPNMNALVESQLHAEYS